MRANGFNVFRYAERRRRIIPSLLASIFLLLSGSAWADRPTILALGDSLTAGYGLGPGEAFPERLQQALAARGDDVRVVNAGVSGDTSGGGLARVDWLLAEKPDLAIIELGANDGLRALDPADTERNIAAIIEKLQGAGVGILLTGMYAPPNLGKDYVDAFNAVFPNLAERYSVDFYPFFLEGVVAQPELNLGDGMHPNAEGVQVIVDNILPSVVKALEKAGG